jgi:hypothetical protein
MALVNGVNSNKRGASPMSITMQSLNDTIIALVTTGGIAVVLSLAIVAAGASFERSRKHSRRAAHPGHAPAQHPVQTDSARELVLR